MFGPVSAHSPPARLVLGIALALLCQDIGSARAQAVSPDFDDHFQRRTMRLDYFHSGGMGEEILALLPQQEPFRFVDEQLRGPYRRWHHEHTFAAIEGGTYAGDIIHDAEYYVLEAQNGERWAAEDERLGERLAELREQTGSPAPRLSTGRGAWDS